MVDFDAFLHERSTQGLGRKLRAAETRHDGRVAYHGCDYVDFSSNDYLGLSNHPRLIRAAIEATQTFGVSASGSRLMSGNLRLHQTLEEKIAEFKNKPAALFFNSGYQANVGIVAAICGKGDAIFSDRLNHASLIDGMKLSDAEFFRFRHNDPEHLESLLKKHRKNFADVLIATETVFSMDGDRAPLEAMVELKEKYHCRLLVDEAHATGLFGPAGSGMVEELNLSERVDFIMGTFSKAMGSFGAYLASSHTAIEYLINACRSFIYSTALPPGVVAANIEAIDLVREEPQCRQKVLQNAQWFRNQLRHAGLKVKGDTQIVPAVLGDNHKTLAAAQKLQQKGYWVTPVRPPTVPPGQACLRFSITFAHERSTLEKVIHDLHDCAI
ncbi:MAG: 8-amino-7-oxononanoate synthase [Phycisphaerae bacterium]|nr:8-amino-7-oxononanoate synthase [Phycisphaerae bacterium]